MASLKGLYDKIASLVKSSNVLTPGTYTPTSTDLVAVYDSQGPVSGDNIVAPKKYVSVTDIGSGGGGGGSMSSFDAQGDGGVLISTDGTTYGVGPVTITDAETLYISAQSVPNGLDWQGAYSSGSAYDINQVVYTNYGSPAIYQTWFAIAAVAPGQAPPTSGTSNSQWALLGTQGPQGTQGQTGLPNAQATAGFKTVSANYTILAADSYGGTNNDTGKIILVNNTASNTTVTISIPENLNSTATGMPFYSQITIINITDNAVYANALVKIEVANTGTMSLYSSDNARYLRTQYSSASFVRNANNVYYMFGDLTNIA